MYKKYVYSVTCIKDGDGEMIDYSYLKSLAKEMITKEKWTWFMYSELWVEIHTGYRIIYVEDMDVANWRTNGIILGCLIFEFVESSNIGIWSHIMYLRCYIWMHEIWDLCIKGWGIKEKNLSNDYIIVEKKWKSWKEVFGNRNIYEKSLPIFFFPSTKRKF